MTKTWIVRFFHPEVGVRLGIQQDEIVYDITTAFPTFKDWLLAATGNVDKAVEQLVAKIVSISGEYPATLFDNPPVSDKPHWLSPLDFQQVWASGVTYKRSQEARQEEAIDGGDVYARVYQAQRPELFFKSLGQNTIGYHGEVGIRSDATWNVPEPELTLVMTPKMEVIGFTVGNDMSSRDIEGENPLYLPQAKMYLASCAIGRGILLAPTQNFPHTKIELTIERGGAVVFYDSINTDQIHRTLGDLVQYLGRSQNFPDGVALMTGTGIVPPADFTLQVGDKITIEIEGISRLTNTVKVV